MKDENINALDEIHKGSCMGMDAIHFVLDKVDDKSLKKELEKQYKEYQDISKEIEDIYPEYNNGEPHETSTMNKVMTWYGIEMNTLMDKSNSKISELVLQGINMGIIEGRKILNHKKIDEKVNKIISKYVLMQEENVENLKKYL
jgi:hypothetical protein